MGIDPTNASAHQIPHLDKTENFIIVNLCGGRQGSQEVQDGATVFEIATTEFADHEWVAQHLAFG
jgi:hypothetical protein